MLNIFKYKSLYVETCEKLATKTNKLKKATDKIIELQRQLIYKNQQLAEEKKQNQERFLLSQSDFKKKIQAKENLRRKSAGKCGALQIKNNQLLKEKQEMRDLINKLIEENQNLKNRKKAPTMQELTNYDLYGNKKGKRK